MEGMERSEKGVKHVFVVEGASAMLEGYIQKLRSASCQLYVRLLLDECAWRHCGVDINEGILAADYRRGMIPRTRNAKRPYATYFN
jgi:hypothetical protein